MRKLLALCLVGLLGLGLGLPAAIAQTTPTPATAELKDVDGNVVGQATLLPAANGTDITVVVSGLTPGEHGIHIHETGQCTPDFQAAGGHFNPTSAEHGLNNPNGPHAGDLPNMTVADDGTATYDTTTDRVTLDDGPNSLYDADGSALIIHANADDQMTNPSGNSGDRVVCGVIQVAADAAVGTPVVGGTATPATGGTADATATPATGGATANLPTTGGTGSNLAWLAGLALILLTLGWLVAVRRPQQPRA